MNKFCYQCGMQSTSGWLEVGEEVFCGEGCLREFEEDQKKAIIQREVTAAKMIGNLCGFGLNRIRVALPTAREMVRMRWTASKLVIRKGVDRPNIYRVEHGDSGRPIGSSNWCLSAKAAWSQAEKAMPEKKQRKLVENWRARMHELAVRNYRNSVSRRTSNELPPLR